MLCLLRAFRHPCHYWHGHTQKRPVAADLFTTFDNIARQLVASVVKWFSEACQLSATGLARSIRCSIIYLLLTKVVGRGFLIGCQLFRDGSRTGCGPTANFVANNTFMNFYSLVERADFPEQKKMVANAFHSTLAGSPISMAVQIVCIYKVAERPRNICIQSATN